MLFYYELDTEHRQNFANIIAKKVESLRRIALNWIDENADDIVNFDDYR